MTRIAMLMLCVAMATPVWAKDVAVCGASEGDAIETPTSAAVSADWGLWEVLIAFTSISVTLFALLISFFGLVLW